MNGRSRHFQAGYLASLWTPGWSLGFLLTGPHLWWQSLLWITPMALPVLLDYFNVETTDINADTAGNRGFSLLLILLAVLFITNTLLLLFLARQWQWDTPSSLANTLADLLAVKFLLGSNATLSGILVAHEMIHRKQSLWRGLGRLLLVLCCYEHFYTEHPRGHHYRLGKPDDPATARFGETYDAYWRRTFSGQFKSAWLLENQRLQFNTLFSSKYFQHRVLQGCVMEVLLLLSIAVFFGGAALLAFGVQTWMAIRNLEAVNYIQHWGLRRSGTKPGPHDAWHTNTWCSHYMLLNLARHAHHHCQPQVPYHQLKNLSTGPRLPHGYFALMFLIAYRNAWFQKLATEELRRLKLGPFADYTTYRVQKS